MNKEKSLALHEGLTFMGSIISVVGKTTMEIMEPF